MAIATVMERLDALRRTKLYDLLTAAPVIAWFMFSVAQMLPSLSQRVALLAMFVQTDPSVLPASLVLRAISEIMTLVFFAGSIVMFTVRSVPRRDNRGL